MKRSPELHVGVRDLRTEFRAGATSASAGAVLAGIGNYLVGGEVLISVVSLLIACSVVTAYFVLVGKYEP